MILSDYKDFPPFGRILGIDWGERRCGLAISDPTRSFVFARQQLYINSEEDLVYDICKLLQEEKCTGIVIGLPVFSNGMDSETTNKVRIFGKNLSDHIDLPIIFIEENLTSISAEDNLKKMSICCRKKILDSESAKIILENAISLLNRQN